MTGPRLPDPITDANGNVFWSGCSVHPNAQLGSRNVFLPFAVVGSGVVMGDGNVVEPFACVAAASQSRAASGHGLLVVGNRNVFHPQSVVCVADAPGAATRVGDGCILMQGSHVGHDDVIGDEVVVGNHASLAGHVHVYRSAVLGSYSCVLQRVKIGPFSHVHPQVACRRSIMPFESVYADQQRRRVNVRAIRRLGGDARDVRLLRDFIAARGECGSPVGLKDVLLEVVRSYLADHRTNFGQSREAK